MARVRDKLGAEIARVRDELGATRKELSAGTDRVRDKLGAEIAKVRDESHQAHAAISERINGVQMYIGQESTALRAQTAELKEDTATLAGAVDVLTAFILGSKDSADIVGTEGHP